MTTPLTPAGLRCAHQTDPLGVAPDRVRFSWILKGEGSGRTQSAYQLHLTQDNPVTNGDTAVWDSGRVESASTADVAYAGPPLTAGRRYHWKVQTWDETGSSSGWSTPAAFETQLDQTNGWHAAWITLGRIREEFGPPSEPGPSDPVANALLPPPYLRREFRVDQPVTSARLYVTALGLYEARLNGQRVGDAMLAPGWTDYAQRIPYQTYDVTALLRPGDNVLGAIAADGWACGFFGFDAKRAGRHYAEAPELLAELVLTLADGTQQRVVTDGQWRAAFAAIRHADLLMGERHDLTREPHGWDAPGFTPQPGACGAGPPGACGAGSTWRPVRVRERDATPLVADPGPPIRVTEEIAPRSIATDDHGRHIVDFGQNLTGWLRIGTGAPPGARVRIRHGEVLTPDGALYTDNLRTARAVDEFTTAGGAEVLEPKFTLHGFRYAEITGYPGDIEQADITAQVVHSDIEAAGSFASSQPWLDQLWRNIDWGQRGNFISVPTDCPQRDERLGWLADAQIFARTACYNRDVAAFFAKWLDDVADAQYDSGVYPDIAPRLNIPWAGAPAWADGGVIVPWTVWKMYGDTAILDRHFAGMARWMDYLERTNPGYLRTSELGNSYNDWLAPVEDKTPPELLATAYWAYDATLMAEMAEATGRAGEAAGYLALLARLRSAFIEAFVAADGQLTSGTQTAYVLALHMDLIPDGLREAAAGHLAEAIRQENWHLTTGFAGVGYILPVLSSTGHDAVAYRLLEQTSAPSWRHMIDAGATTIWERWDGWTKEHGFQSAWMNSFNHYSLGSVGEWLYRFVLGIDQEPGADGFGRLLVRPHPGGTLTWARGTYRSVRGPVACGWRRDGGRFTFSLELPPNVTASVRIPSDDPAAVRDQAGARPGSVAGYPGAPGAQEAVFTVGSGSHEFTGSALSGGFPGA